MPRKPKPPPDDPEQSKRFINMAREIGADASQEEFERAFEKVARPKPAEPSGEPNVKRGMGWRKRRPKT
jgi:hypothetical protein